VKVCEGITGGGKTETTGVGFVKQVGFEPSETARELRMSRVVNQKRKK